MKISINLLPEPVKKELALKTVLSQTLSLIRIISLIFIFLGLAISLWYFNLIINLQNIWKEKAVIVSSIQKLSSIENKLTTILDRHQKISALDKNRILFSTVFLEIQKLIPSNVSLTDISINLDLKPQITVSGKTQNREIAASLADAFQKSPSFSDINFQKTTFLSDDTNPVSFTITFNLQK